MEQFLAEAGLTDSDMGTARAVGAMAPEATSRSRHGELRVVVGEPSWYQRRGKRIVDVVAASVLLIALAPVMVVIAVAIRLQLGPGVLFQQERVGLGGGTFTMLKFRTMLHDRRTASGSYSGTDRRLHHKRSDDPRHTPLGRFLRRTSLDELPQLINVLRGDMSLIGPRPELVGVALRHGIVDHPRHRVRPGITGLWQVSPLRAGAEIQRGLLLDSQYVANVTLAADVKILLRTAAAVVRMGGS